MHTLVAFTGTPPSIPAALARVEVHYRPLHAAPPVRREMTGPSVGVIQWEAATVPSRWPAWVERPGQAVASVYTPLGVERITLAHAEVAPFVLADALRAAPARITDLTPPYVGVAVDTRADRLDLFTDALGIGRLFEVRTPWGWVWSNRPVAALLMAGLDAVPDPVGWTQSAVTDEFYGRTTPFQGVSVVGAATHVHWDGGAQRLTVSALDVATSLLTADPESRIEDLLDEAAADLAAVTASIGRWYPGTPVVDLSGGRDSRLVAAAFLAGGTEVTLHSHDAVPGDLDMARDLVARLGDTAPEHRITRTATGDMRRPAPFAAMDSGRAWHVYAEGLRPATYLHYSAPGTLDRHGPVVVGGAGGDVGHGYCYHPSDAVPFEFTSADAADPLRAGRTVAEYARRIVQRHCPVPGITLAARESVVDRVATELARIQECGVAGPTLLDHVYLAERMRRWGTTPERSGIVSPLLTPSFQRAAVALHPHQRRANVLHRLLTDRLVPAWEGVPYFPSEMPAQTHPPRRAPRVVRLADCTDAVEVEQVIASPDSWGYPFDAGRLAHLWRRSEAGETTAAEERLLRAAVWRATFADVVADLGRAPRPLRAGSLSPADPVSTASAVAAVSEAPAPAPPVPRESRESPPDLAGVTIAQALLTTDAVKRFGRSTAWRQVRDTTPGRLVRRLVAVPSTDPHR